MSNKLVLAVQSELLKKSELMTLFNQSTDMIEQIYCEAKTYIENVLTQNENALEEEQKRCILKLIGDYACSRAIKNELSIEPIAGIGCGLGQLSIAVCSGFISLNEGIELLSKSKISLDDRPQIMIRGINSNIIKEKCPESIQAILSEDIVILNKECGQAETYEEIWRRNGALIEELENGSSFEHLKVQINAEDIEELLQRDTERRFQWSILSNITGNTIKEACSFIEYLTEESREPIYWNEVTKYLKDNQIHYLYEMGNKGIIGSILKNGMKYIKTYSCKGKEDLEDIRLAWNDFKYSFSGKCLGYAVCCPNFNTNSNEFIEKVVDVIKEFKRYSLKQENSNEETVTECIETSINYLKRILDGKKVPAKLQKEIMDEVLVMK